MSNIQTKESEQKESKQKELKEYKEHKENKEHKFQPTKNRNKKYKKKYNKKPPQTQYGYGTHLSPQEALFYPPDVSNTLERFHHPSHPHRLFRNIARNMNIFCDNIHCGKRLLNNEVSYVCFRCDYDLCAHCYTLPTPLSSSYELHESDDDIDDSVNYQSSRYKKKSKIVEVFKDQEDTDQKQVGPRIMLENGVYDSDVTNVVNNLLHNVTSDIKVVPYLSGDNLNVHPNIIPNSNFLDNNLNLDEKYNITTNNNQNNAHQSFTNMSGESLDMRNDTSSNNESDESECDCYTDLLRK